MTEYMTSDPDEPNVLVSDDDRAWFEDHPDRFLHIRHATDGDGDPREVRSGAFPSMGPAYGRCRVLPEGRRPLPLDHRSDTGE
jgi:hypothetical protein